MKNNLERKEDSFIYPDIRQQVKSRLSELIKYFEEALSELVDISIVENIQSYKDKKPIPGIKINYKDPERKTGAKRAILLVKKSEWPKDLPLPLTINDAIKTVKNGQKLLIDSVCEEISYTATACMDPKTRKQALCRPFVSREWPWSDKHSPGKSIRALLSILETPPPKEFPHWSESPHSQWNPRAAFLDVARWAKPGLNKIQKGLGNDFLKRVENRQSFDFLEMTSNKQLLDRLNPPGLALLFLAEEEVKEGLKRSAIAVDAGRPHHDLFTGWRTASGKHRRTGSIKARYTASEERVELFDRTKNKCVQLTVDAEDGSLQEEIIKALRDTISPEGFKHWAALLLLMSKQGARQGWVRWTMEDHLNALGYSERVRYNQQRLDEIAKVIELFTKLELIVYNPTGTIRAESPLVHVGTRYKRLEKSRWQLDGLELRINPLLYSGVRNMETGKPGNQWFPVPEELAQIDHIRHPNAIPLALLMAIRWHWDLFQGDQQKKYYLALKGKNLLELADMEVGNTNKKRTWIQLERELDELKKIGLLGRWEWHGQARSQEGVCRFYPAEWLLDRTIRKLRPTEAIPIDIPKTGKELRSWREEKGWTQANLAKHIGVSRKTIIRAESQSDKKITSNLSKALKNSA